MRKPAVPRQSQLKKSYLMRFVKTAEGAMSKFRRGGGCFNPSFSKTDEIRVVRV